MATRFDVLTVGSAVRDVFLISKAFRVVKDERFATGEGECVALGSKVEAQTIALATGGGATNTAATFATLGYRTAAVARIGSDSFGHEIADDLKARGVSTALLVKDAQRATAVSVLLTLPTGERTAVVHRGASAAWGADDIAWSKIRASWLYLTSVGDGQLASQFVSEAKRYGMSVAWNPGLAEMSAIRRSRFDALGMVDVLILNREEAGALFQKPAAEAKELLERFLAHTDRQIVVVTDGMRGAFARQSQRRWHASTTRVRSVSRTGAGDAFGSAFVAGLFKKLEIPHALQLATLNAQSVIQHVGAKAGILSRWPTDRELARIKVRTYGPLN